MSNTLTEPEAQIDPAGPVKVQVERPSGFIATWGPVGVAASAVLVIVSLFLPVFDLGPLGSHNFFSEAASSSTWIIWILLIGAAFDLGMSVIALVARGREVKVTSLDKRLAPKSSAQAIADPNRHLLTTVRDCALGSLGLALVVLVFEFLEYRDASDLLSQVGGGLGLGFWLLSLATVSMLVWGILLWIDLRKNKTA